ncbi:c-type cytochrome [Telmatospirillum sp. J64-1]|uniref:c-type cytochrome n=1 Tax=Telmatospirillum sp. J64-1 TaxID=2502183 RepID=UPI00163D5508|nr:c-type cytochrome [Telmatospirillum sp. J64-1]
MLIVKAALPLAAALLLAAQMPAAAQGPQDRSALLADTCAGCHGPDGNSTGAIPAIRGQDAQAIEQALLAFKSEAREGSVMNRIAKGYTDDEIALIARYLGRK